VRVRTTSSYGDEIELKLRKSTHHTGCSLRWMAPASRMHHAGR
jgi:hypothetical protein